MPIRSALPPMAVPMTPGGVPLTDAWVGYFQALDQYLRAGEFFPSTDAADNNAAGHTLTVANFLAGILLRTGPVGAFSDATPTAADIVAAISRAAINSNRVILIRNGGGGLMTLTAGTGLTLAGTTTIASGSARFYSLRVTAIAKGAEAVTLRGLITGTM